MGEGKDTVAGITYKWIALSTRGAPINRFIRARRLFKFGRRGHFSETIPAGAITGWTEERGTLLATVSAIVIAIRCNFCPPGGSLSPLLNASFNPLPSILSSSPTLLSPPLVKGMRLSLFLFRVFEQIRAYESEPRFQRRALNIIITNKNIYIYFYLCM